MEGVGGGEGVGTWIGIFKNLIRKEKIILLLLVLMLLNFLTKKDLYKN